MIILRIREKQHVKGYLEIYQGTQAWWLLPVIIFILLIGVLLVLGGGSALAPFIYTIF